MVVGSVERPSGSSPQLATYQYQPSASYVLPITGHVTSWTVSFASHILFFLSPRREESFVLFSPFLKKNPPISFVKSFVLLILSAVNFPYHLGNTDL